MEAVFIAGVITGMVILAVALAIYAGISDSVKRNKEENEWIRASYGVSIHTLTDQMEKPSWSYDKEEMMRKSTDNGEAEEVL